MSSILGLDVSSTTIGWGLLDTSTNPPTLKDCGFIKPLKNTSIFASLDQVRTDVWALLDRYRPEEVAIEDIVQFMQGQSGAKTIIKLAIYNRFVGMVVRDNLNFEPKLLNVNSIRSKIRVGKDRPKKEDIPDVVQHHLKLSTFPWQYKLNKRTKQNEVIEESYDIADGIAVALAFHLGARPILKVKKVKKK